MVFKGSEQQLLIWLTGGCWWLKVQWYALMLFNIFCSSHGWWLLVISHSSYNSFLLSNYGYPSKVHLWLIYVVAKPWLFKSCELMNKIEQWLIMDEYWWLLMDDWMIYVRRNGFTRRLRTEASCDGLWYGLSIGWGLIIMAKWWSLAS